MASKIRVLSDTTINKIAAGEVIENPASCVKELIENSIDAGSDEIIIEIKGGGRQLIRISDNGSGMNKDDAILCFERHATSKINSVEDIFNISSMGFRGEAIPSIASISKMTLLTKTEDENEGFLVINHGGKIIKTASCTRSRGTTVEISSLFYNVPVRKKFQRSPNYDVSVITKVVSTFAIANPAIKFQLISNGRVVFNLLRPKKETMIEKLSERIPEALGHDFFAGLVPLEFDAGNLKLAGYIGVPSFTRNNRTGQHLFINKRCVFSPFLSYAVKEGFGTSIAPNRFPVFVLFFDAPLTLVDINVHPQKKEVRLRQEQDLKDFFLDAIQSSLGESVQEHFVSFPKFEEANFVTNPMKSQFILPQMNIEEASEVYYPEQTAFVQEEKEVIAPQVVASISGYLILLKENDDLLFVDQKRAHARIIYEKLQKADSDPFIIQNLLIPYNVEMTAQETSIIKESLPDLNRLGVKIQEFGKSGFVVNALPTFLKESNINTLLFEIVENFGDSRGRESIDKQKDKWLAGCAAKASVNKGKKLTIFEGQELVNQLFRCSMPQACPFGKNTFASLTSFEMHKLF